MDKLKDMFENVVILFEAAKDNPKKSVLTLITVLFAIYMGYKAVSRIPSAIGCFWKAEVSQSVPSELWRFNLVTNECQYYNSKRWIPLDKVIDVGGGEDFDESDI